MTVTDYDGALAAFCAITKMAMAGVELLDKTFDENLAIMREQMVELGNSEAEIAAAEASFTGDRAAGRDGLIEKVWIAALAATVRINGHTQVTFHIEPPK